MEKALARVLGAIDLASEPALRLMSTLEEIGAEISGQTRPQGVAAVIARGATAIDDAVGISVALGLDDDEPLRLVVVDGFERETVEQWSEIPRDAHTPLTDVLASGTPMLIPNREAMFERYPSLRPQVESQQRSAWAVLPLKVGKTTKGVVGLAWTHPRELAAHELLFLSTLGKLGGEALIRSIADQERRALLVRLAETVEDVRSDIAADLHDDAIQRVAAVQYRLASLANRNGSDDEVVAAIVGQCRTDLSSVVDTLRDLVFTLVPPDLEQGDLGPSLRDFVSWRFGPAQGRVTIIDRIGGSLPGDVALTTYRIAQEALTNAYKHAGPCEIDVELTIRDDGNLRLRIQDDGRGAEPEALTDAQDGHIGFRTMRERAESFGGTLFHRSVPGQGFRVIAELPLGR